MGSLVGTAVLGAVVTHPVATGRSANLSPAAHQLSPVARQALAMSIQHAFLVTLGVGVCILIITLFLKDVRLRKRGEEMSLSGATGATMAPELNDATRSGSLL